MDWTKGQIFDFIKLYEKYDILWNTQHPDHKNRTLTSGAWLNIQDELGMNLDVGEIKRKKESLLATYRTLKRKLLRSQDAGISFKPTWFAFNSLDRFLRDKTLLSVEDDVEDKTADENPEEEVYEDFVEITDIREVEPEPFSAKRATGCLRKPFSRRSRELKAYEELRKKKLQLEVRKLEVEVKEKERERPSQTMVESKTLEKLRKRKLELEIRKLELDVWEHEEILGIKHSKLTNTIERVNNNNDIDKHFGIINQRNNSVSINHSESFEAEEYNKSSVNSEQSEY